MNLGRALTPERDATITVVIVEKTREHFAARRVLRVSSPWRLLRAREPEAYLAQPPVNRIDLAHDGS